MLPLLAPVFAQLITLGVHDRTEARYLDSYDSRYEASTAPGVELTFTWPRYDLSLGYDTSLLVTPLEEQPRELLVYHTASFVTSYRFRHTVLSLSSTGSFGEVNFIVQPLQTATPLTPDDVTGDAPGAAEPEPAQPNAPAQPQPGATPGAMPGAMPGVGAVPLQPRVFNRTVRYGTWATTANVAHDASRELKLNAFASYNMGGALDEAERANYPLTRGTVVGVAAANTKVWSARDGFVTSLSLQQAWSSAGNRALSGVARETWNHKFDKRLSGFLGGGVSVTRISQDNGLVAISVFPDFATGLAYQRLLARGTLSFALGAYSTPVLDPLRATVDPRIGTAGSIGWSRDRFSTSLSGGLAISTAPKDANQGAFDSYQASYVASYQLADWFGLDAGGRLAKQQYQETNTVPLSYAVFLGVNLAYDIPLVGDPKK
jgi:hypothetical protein